jgi:segregation and condensation protein B
MSDDSVPETPPDPEPAAASAAPPAPIGLPEAWLRLAEALVFAAAAPVPPRALAQLLPEEADASEVLAALRARYAGRGVELIETAGGVQFRTAPDLAPLLRKVIEVPRRLPRVAMETLAIIAWHQPVTRAEIEAIRGASLSQQTLDALLEADLITSRGRRETPGRPTLWGTTMSFLTRFGLKDLRELPRREELLVEPAVLPPAAQEAPADATAGDDPAAAARADPASPGAAEGRDDG